MAQYGIFQYGTDQYGLGEPEAGEGSGRSVLRQQFNINQTVSILGNLDTLELRTTFNQFDEFGLINGIQRITGEPNWSYKRRIFDVFVHRANSTYRGLVNGITRELGLSLFQSLIINPKVNNSTGEFLAPDPYILFDGIWVYLYSDFANSLLDYQIDRFESGGNFENLVRLVEFINTTTNFEAGLLDTSIGLTTKSVSILNQSNRGTIINEDIPQTTKIKLKYSRIIRGSLFLNDFSAFKTEVNLLENVNEIGQYYVDYENGIITVFAIPTLGTFINYQYVVYPFKPFISPIILHDINNENFRIKMFEQVFQNDGIQVNGIPTEMGVDIINELLSVHPMYWGV